MFAFFITSTRLQRHAATRHAPSDHFAADASVCMDISDLPANAVDRLMARIDHYMQCELDVQYDHSHPEEVRVQLREELEQELTNARQAGWLLPGYAANSAMRQPGALA